MLRSISIYAFLILALLPAQGFAKVFDAKTKMLDNGMQVVVVENKRAPVITHMVWYKVGAADEPIGTSGIAHFLEHLMFKGSEGMAPGEFSKVIRSMGGNDNAFTSQDYTAYFQSVSSDQLEKVMTMEAGRMRGLNVPETELLSERKVIIEERHMRTDNDPNARFDETLDAALFVNHPYGIPVIGWENEMAKLSWNDAKSFYDKWYAPNNAILVVSGNVKAEDVFALAEKIYGKLERVNTPERNRPVSPPLPGRSVITHYDKDVRQPVFQRNYRVPSSRQDKDKSLALQVLETIFGDGPTSRLYKSLVVEQKLAVSAGLSYRADTYDDATLTVYAIPAPGIEMDTLIKAVDTEIKKLADEGVTEQEIGDSINSLQNEAIYARDSLTGPAMVIGYSLVTGSTLDDIENWPDDIAKVTAEQIKDVAASLIYPYSKDAHYVTGLLYPAAMDPNADSEGESEVPEGSEAMPPAGMGGDLR